MALIKTTKIILAVIIIGLVLYDILAISLGGVEATISYITLIYSKECPVIPFAVGFVSGHLFWPQKNIKEDN